MNKKLEKVCEEAIKGMEQHVCSCPSEYDCCLEEDSFDKVFKKGFQYAIESKQVQRLVKELEDVLCEIGTNHDFYYDTADIEQALKAFEGDSDEQL